MHDLLLANQTAPAPEQLRGYAERLGLDPPRFTADMTSMAAEAAIISDKQLGQWSGLTHVPAFLVDGKLIDAPTPAAAKGRIARVLEEERTAAH